MCHCNRFLSSIQEIRVISYEWDFDEDGEIDATGPSVEYTPANGESVVVLRITDDAGQEAVVTQAISRGSGSVEPSQGRSIETALDVNGNNRLDDSEILEAFDKWVKGEPVEGTDGKTIDDNKMVALVDKWVKGEPLNNGLASNAAPVQPQQLTQATVRRSIEVALDINENNRLDDSEILEAFKKWVKGEPVEGTDGMTISDTKMLALVEKWVKGKTLNKALSQRFS